MASPAGDLHQRRPHQEATSSRSCATRMASSSSLAGRTRRCLSTRAARLTRPSRVQEHKDLRRSARRLPPPLLPPPPPPSRAPAPAPPPTSAAATLQIHTTEDYFREKIRKAGGVVENKDDSDDDGDEPARPGGVQPGALHFHPAGPGIACAAAGPSAQCPGAYCAAGASGPTYMCMPPAERRAQQRRRVAPPDAVSTAADARDGRAAAAQAPAGTRSSRACRSRDAGRAFAAAAGRAAPAAAGRAAAAAGGGAAAGRQPHPQQLGMPPQQLGMLPQQLGMPSQHMGLPPLCASRGRAARAGARRRSRPDGRRASATSGPGGVRSAPRRSRRPAPPTTARHPPPPAAVGHPAPQAPRARAGTTRTWSLRRPARARRGRPGTGAVSASNGDPALSQPGLAVDALTRNRRQPRREPCGLVQPSPRRLQQPSARCSRRHRHRPRPRAPPVVHAQCGTLPAATSIKAEAAVAVQAAAAAAASSSSWRTPPSRSSRRERHRSPSPGTTHPHQADDAAPPRPGFATCRPPPPPTTEASAVLVSAAGGRRPAPGGCRARRRRAAAPAEAGRCGCRRVAQRGEPLAWWTARGPALPVLSAQVHCIAA